MSCEWHTAGQWFVVRPFLHHFWYLPTTAAHEQPSRSAVSVIEVPRCHVIAICLSSNPHIAAVFLILTPNTTYWKLVFGWCITTLWTAPVQPFICPGYSMLQAGVVIMWWLIGVSITVIPVCLISFYCISPMKSYANEYIVQGTKLCALNMTHLQLPQLWKWCTSPLRYSMCSKDHICIRMESHIFSPIYIFSVFA